jgi:carbonic anhydrase/SulP family sulfate permease
MLRIFSPKTLPKDLLSGLVVFLVALPLCLGVALASNAPLFSGLVAGIVGGLVVGSLSRSSTSVSGPAAGLTAVVAAQIAALGSFEAFLLAVLLAGVIQVVLGISQAGSISAFFPTSVIKGLLSAIGLILILKQIPHLLGHDDNPEGNLSFLQPDQETTFSELGAMLSDYHLSTALIGLLSLALLIAWDRVGWLKRTLVPAPLVVVLLGVALALLFERFGGAWVIDSEHLVQVPVADSFESLLGFLRAADFSQLGNPTVYVAAVTIAVVASLETLLNLEAVDKIDPQQRTSPPNPELLAQGAGNIACGLLGGLPVTSVIIRSTVNINSGGKTKLATITHGFLLLGCVAMVPTVLNRIPLSALAAILLMTGVKLASPKLMKQMWAEGRNQFLPYAATVLAIVLTDLLIGIVIGMVTAVSFILHSSLKRPMKRIVEKHVGGEVLRIELGNQVSFLNRASLQQTLYDVPRGGHVLLDARSTDYIDPDVLDLITDFRDTTAPVHGVDLSMVGFKDRYRIEDRIQYVDYTSRDLQSQMSPQQALQMLREGNERFRTGQRLTRDFSRQVAATASGQFPQAVVLSCIDSRTPAELIFDLGLGDIFSIRIAGNVAREKVLGSMEYSCAVAGAKLVVVLGHTRCGAVTSSVDLLAAHQTAANATGCNNLDRLVIEIQKSIDESDPHLTSELSVDEKHAFVDSVARAHVLRTIGVIREESSTLRELEDSGRIAIVGGMYDISTGRIEFFDRDGLPPFDDEASDAIAAAGSGSPT